MQSDDGGNLPPRGPRPQGPRSQPLPPSGFDEGASTFRPSPKPDRGPRKRPRQPGATAGAPEADDSDRAAIREGRGEATGPSWSERLVFGSVSSAHLASFCRQLSRYLESGVDLLRSLAALETQFRGSALGPVIGRLQRSIKRGDSLSDAMAREPGAFDRLTMSMMRVAEARGGMPEVLRQLADHFENRVRLFRRARSAMIYPTIVVIVAAAVGYLLTVFVLPEMIALLPQNVSLPLPTRILIAMSNFMRVIGWWLVPIAAVGAVFGLVRFYRTAPGKALMDRLALKVPVLGKLIRLIDTTRFARTLSTLLEAGVDYDTSMRLTAEALHSVPFRRAVRKARTGVLEGRELSEALGGTHRFSVDVIEVLASGEATGRLPETLEHLAADYEEQVDRMVANLGQLVQPVLTLVIGAIVFFIVLAFVMAYIAVLMDLAGGL